MKVLNLVNVCLVLTLLSCVEKIDFAIDNDQPLLVVNGFVSNKSFDETLLIPSDGRFFSVQLSTTSKVTKVRDEPVIGASVYLEDNSNNTWYYTDRDKGKYVLEDPQFKVLEDQLYRLNISYGDERYLSNWEELPKKGYEFGDLSFDEVVLDVLVYEGADPVLVKKKGISVHAKLEEIITDKIYTYWDFEPYWIYKAPLATASNGDVYCWATNEIYISDYVLKSTKGQSYVQELFAIETVRNEMVYEEFTAIVKQLSVSPEYYYFLEDLQKQADRGGLFDQPPYNVKGNLYKEGDGNSRVSGYFAIVNEQSERWYFDKSELSYRMISETLNDCLVDYGAPVFPNSCYSCLAYDRGYPNATVTNVKPSWWR
jgi:hypothetical protein